KFRRKGKNRAQKGIFIGFEPNQKSYRVLRPDKKVILSHSINCNEQNWQNVEEQQQQVFPAEYENKHLPKPVKVEEKRVIDSQTEEEPGESSSSTGQMGDEVQQPSPRRSQRENKGIPPQRHGQITICNVTVPKSYEDIQKLPASEKVKWKKAMQDEIHALCEKQVFEQTELPQGAKTVSCRWVFKIKRNEAEDIYKARLVARGFSQVQGQDYDLLFSPTVCSTSLRIILVLSALRGWHVHQSDIKTAYLNAPLEEEI
ncbi:hypothetical protein JRQ81_001435, partial [Phrynocephalus forsythii]